MRWLRSFRFTTVLLLVLLASGCRPSARPTPTVAAVLPTATAQLAPTALPMTRVVTDTVTLAPFRINLPVSASVFYPTDATWTSQLAQLEQKEPQLATYLAALATSVTTGAGLALVHLPVAEERLTLIAAAVPSEGLTLQTYLTAAQADLAQSRLALGTGLVVQQATIRYDLHEANIPLATLQYTHPVSGNATTENVSGYQAAMLDHTGNQLLLLTFIAAPTPMAAAQEQITTILTHLQETMVTQ